MADSHSSAIARKVAAQLAEAIGFDATQESAIEVLSGIINRYIAQLCRSAHDFAELGGRTKLNVIDLLLVLEEMNVNLDELDKYVETQVLIHCI
jgi:histone H3/H4